MTTIASPQIAVDSTRAVERVRAGLPAHASPRALALRVAQRTMPVVARSVAAGMAVLAVEQAVRRLVDGAAQRALPARRVEPEPRPYVATVSMTETIVIERMRRRR